MIKSVYLSYDFRRKRPFTILSEIQKKADLVVKNHPPPPPHMLQCFNRKSLLSTHF